MVLFLGDTYRVVVSPEFQIDWLDFNEHVNAADDCEHICINWKARLQQAMRDEG